MGIIIVPILFIAVGTFLLSGIYLVSLMRKKQISIYNLIGGLCISVLLFLYMYMSYEGKFSEWALSPYIEVPFNLFIYPFVLALILKFIKNDWCYFISKSIVVSIVFSGIITIIFNQQIFGILDILNIEKTY